MIRLLLVCLLFVIVVGCAIGNRTNIEVTGVNSIYINEGLQLVWDSKAQVCILTRYQGGVLLVDRNMCSVHGLIE